MNLHMIMESNNQSKDHLHDTHNNREFHFQSVCVCDFIDSQLPNLVE